ncbi:type II toxin-antitoxin system VapC family toxin [Akkermansiaceae bacterium]|nr:type II toxin-antitoxin system VapC family toxin [Akkermansiaceae bacterium]
MPKLNHLVAAVLDTHVWVWASSGDARAEALKDFRGAAIVSAISTWEVSMLAMKNRLELKPDEETWLQENLASPVSLEPLSPEISIASCQLPEFHGDPADRIIVATAITLGIPLLTADQKIIAWNKKARLLKVIEI